MATKLRKDLEPRWVSWYCAKTFPRAIVKYRCPLGPIPEQVKEAFGVAKGTRIYRPWRPEVDACAITLEALFLIEAKVQKFMDGVQKLPVYKSLVPDTPELSPWRGLPIITRLLIPQRIEWVEVAAQKFQVQVVTEAPDFIIEEWQQRDRYWTKEALEKREARKEKLRELGYE